VVAEVTERLAVSEQAAQKFDVERFNLRKLNELKVRKQYQIEISNRFAALENLNVSEDTNRAWENIKDNTKTSAKESLNLYNLKQHKPRFNEESLHFLDQRTQQWLWLPNQSNVDNLNNVRCVASRQFRNKKNEYLKAKIEELQFNSKIKTMRDFYRGISDFKKG
jgi:hypothetical protein